MMLASIDSKIRDEVHEMDKARWSEDLDKLRQRPIPKAKHDWPAPFNLELET